MAAPVVVATSSGQTSGYQTSHSISAPAGGSGDYLVIFTATVANYGSESATGCTLLDGGTTPSSSGLTLRCWYKVAASSSSESIAVSTADSALLAYTVYRVSGVSGFLSANNGSAGGIDPQPPSLTVSDLSVDHRYIAGASWDGSYSVAAFPYSGNQLFEDVGGNVGVATCEAVVLSSPITPVDFTMSPFGPIWSTLTVGIAGSSSTIDEGGDGCGGIGWCGPHGPATITEGADACSASGQFIPLITGTCAKTEHTDTCAGSGAVTAPVYTGTAAVVEQADARSASGTVTAPVYTGTGATTEGVDSCSGSGAVTAPVYTGVAAAQEDSDTASASGTYVLPSATGSMSKTEQVDAPTASGTFIPLVTGTSSVSEQADAGVAAGAAYPPGDNGTVAVTESADACSSSGSVLSGNMYESQDVIETAGIASPPGSTEHDDPMEAYGHSSPNFSAIALTTESPDSMSAVGEITGGYIIELPDVSAATGTSLAVCPIVKAWNGSAWVAVPSKVYISGSWVLVTKVKIYRGGAWIGCT